MRALVQRVSKASVRSRRSEGDPWEVVGAIEAGLCVLVGVTHGDTTDAAERLADKIAGLRIFDDEHGVMNRSVVDVGGSLLVVSQFTLYGNTAKGRRPSWIDAAPPETAEPLVAATIEALRQRELTVETGRFRTEMQVELVNDGPVTLMLEI
jgi:D-aminoacyl-tRNA deacylase